MIDVQPYIDKLDKLREYMFMIIDGHGKSWYINLDALRYECDEMTPEKIVDLYMQTGIFLESSNKQRIDNPRKIPFEEWLKLNTTNTTK